MAAQRFSDPQIPFHREIHSGVSIGTSIVISARAYQDQKKSLELQLKSRTDIALNLVIPLNRAGQLSVNARVNDQYTSEIQKPINVPLNTPFVLHIRVDTHVSEVYLNDTHLLDFVHRVNPLEIKEVFMEGPLIISEVIFKPPSGASLEPLPSYDEASKSVLPEFNNLSIGPSQALPPYNAPQVIPTPPTIRPPPVPVAPLSGPPPAGTVVPRGAQTTPNKPPYPEKDFPGGVPFLPDKKSLPPGTPGGYPPQPVQPMAQVAPQPAAPPLSQIANRSPTAYPPNLPNPPIPQAQQYPLQQYPQPGGYVPPSNYPSAPPAPQTVYPTPNPPVPSQQPNVYPGPNPVPGQMYPYGQPGSSQPMYPQQAYPMYQAGYPQTYAAPSYPMYSYNSMYYDSCDVSSYCYPRYSYYDSCHHHHHHC